MDAFNPGYYAILSIGLLAVVGSLTVVAQGLYVALTTRMLPSPPDAPRGAWSYRDGTPELRPIKDSKVDDEPSSPPSGAQIRVLVVGDSVVEGTGLAAKGHLATIAPHIARAIGTRLHRMHRKL